MKNQEHIEKLVNETLGSIEGAKRATANPFLYTRVKQALSQSPETFPLTGLIKKPAFAFATVLLVFAINALVIFKSTDNNNTVLQEDEQQFAREYSYAASTADRFYSLNDEQP